MDMGHFTLTQPNTTQQLTDPTQPILPANRPTQPTHLVTKQLKHRRLILVRYSKWSADFDNFQA